MNRIINTSIFKLPFVVGLLLSICMVCLGCNNNGDNHTDPNQSTQVKNEVDMWLTSSDQKSLLTKQNTVIAFTEKPNNYPSIVIDTSIEFQSIDGFGYTLTGGSAKLMQQMSSFNRDQLLQEIFGCSGDQSCISYLRISIGASDLDEKVFSYNDLHQDSTDYTLKKFSLGYDTLYLLPLLKSILKIKPDIKLMATPWSPPIWMKTNKNSIGGSLKPECYGVYADYFVKYIQYMANMGVNIDAVTIQNEPQHGGNNPSLVMSSTEQANFIKDHLGPKFEAAGLKTKIIIWDHNCDQPTFPISILNVPSAKKYIDGSAFHLYNGDISALSQVHAIHPEKNLYFTEQWTGANGTFGEDLIWHIKNVIIGSTRNWSKVALEWNLANDPAYKPHTPGGCTQCKGAYTIDKNISVKNVSYYIIAHASRFVSAGAKRVKSTDIDKIHHVVFLRKDGKKAMIAANETENNEIFNIELNGKKAIMSLPAKSVATFVW